MNQKILVALAILVPVAVYTMQQSKPLKANAVGFSLWENQGTVVDLKKSVSGGTPPYMFDIVGGGNNYCHLYIKQDGTATIQAANNYQGPVYFSYKVTDSAGNSATAGINIRIDSLGD